MDQIKVFEKESGEMSGVGPVYILTNSTADLQGGEEESSFSGARGVAEIIGIGVVLGVLDLTTVLGNLLVCVTIVSTRRLRNTTNYFILSLAFSDFLLGVLVLPFSTINTILPSWPLGPVFCNIFVSSDVMLCTVSILNLFAISLERYFAVAVPLKYAKVLTFRRVIYIISSIWIFSFVMAFIPIHLGWNTLDGRIGNYAAPWLCLFEGNKLYVLLVAISTYFIPLVIMCVVYIRVFMIAHDQVQRINQLVKSTIRVFNPSSANTKDPRFASDSKATVTLASVILAFAICWIPYFVLFTIRPFVSMKIDIHLDLFTLWLGYINSMLNPFLYAFHSNQFRRGFIQVLTRKRYAYPFEKGQYV